MITLLDEIDFAFDLMDSNYVALASQTRNFSGILAQGNYFLEVSSPLSRVGYYEVLFTFISAVEITSGDLTTSEITSGESLITSGEMTTSLVTSGEVTSSSVTSGQLTSGRITTGSVTTSSVHAVSTGREITSSRVEVTTAQVAQITIGEHAEITTESDAESSITTGEDDDARISGASMLGFSILYVFLIL